MKHLILRLVCWAALLALVPQPATAQSGAFTYQGRVQVQGQDFTGTGQFKFALVTVASAEGQALAAATVVNGFVVGYTVNNSGFGYTNAPRVTIIDASGTGAQATAVINTNGSVIRIDVNNPGAGYTANPTVVIDPPGGEAAVVTHWSNDGTSVSGSQPLNSVSLPVSGGAFTVVLGDLTSLAMQNLDASVFARPGLRLRIWFNDGLHGFSRLEPAQLITPTPYASHARGVAWTNVTDVPAGFTNFVQYAGPGLSLVSNTVGIASNAVTTAMLASNAVTTGEIANGTVVREDLAPSLLTGAFWTLSGNARVTDTNNPASTNAFLGTTDNFPLNFHVRNVRALRLEPTTNGAPNIVGGYASNSVGSGAMGVVIAGGGAPSYPPLTNPVFNRVEADFGTIGGGFNNRVHLNADGATIAGGSVNSVGNNSARATVSGGEGNAIGAGSSHAVIGGGRNNFIATNSSQAVVSGGQFNVVLTNSGSATLAGGRSNAILNDAPHAVVGGGYLNTNGARNATIPGGTLNAALAPNSFAAGQRAKALHQGSFVWGDGHDADVSTTASNQVVFRSLGGFRIQTGPSTNSGVVLGPNLTSWNTPSDRALKKNRAAVDGREVLEKLASIPIDRWNYVWEDDATTPHLGPMAQDFKRAFYPGTDDTTISTLEFDGVALAAIQGLNRKLEDKDAELRALRREVEELKRLIRDAAPQR